MKRRGLGRGLDALLGAASAASAASVASAASAAPAAPVEGILRQLALEQIVRSRYQPRAEIRADGLEELAASIRRQGLVQPIVVRAEVAGHYELIAGERRWRAAQLAGLTEVPALVREVSDQVALAMALIENIQREDLNALEEAQAVKRLIDEFQLTHQEAADAIGRSRAAISNLLRLLELTGEVQQLLQEQKLEMGHARALLPLPPPLQREAARQVLIRGLSVRETEALVHRLLDRPAAGVAATAADPNVRALQQDLSERLGARVLVQHSSSGKGRLVIHYNTLDELDGILSRVK